MLEKINSKKNFQFSNFPCLPAGRNLQSIFKFLILNFKLPIFIFLFLLLFYTRFINIGWGLPYPMHPDERNMANAIQGLNCKVSIFNFQFSNLRECFNPHFFAYGQFPLYLGYLTVYFLKFFDGDMGFPISFQEAAISLRIISAIASIINVLILLKIIKSIISNFQFSIFNKFSKFNFQLFSLIIIIFSPFFIQFSHFGTTESLLMLFYSLIVYLSMKMLERHTTYEVVWLSLVSGLAVATKVSSLIFLAVPFIALISHLRQDFGGQAKLSSKLKVLNLTLGFALFTLIFALAFSPHNLINFQEFINAIRYESDVAFGRSLVFYTRQFFKTQPFMFQFEKVFPYTLGWPVYIMGLIGFMSLDWTNRKINLLRFGFLVYFIPSAVIFAKWSRFMAPILPLILIFTILFLVRVKIINFIKIIIVIIAILPGIAYLSVYQKPDVRLQASEWIYNNIPTNSYILSETANVIDIPLEVYDVGVGHDRSLRKVYQVISFNFYDLDESTQLQQELKDHLEKADYIFVPSRRIFTNHTCQGNFQFSIFNFQSNLKSKCQILKNKYPVLNKYYEDLFNGKLGFEKVAEFSSELNDEQAEETWTVFDHPVIRIYKKVK